MGDKKSNKPYGGGKTDRPRAIYLNTRGNGTLAVGVCQRCDFKFPLLMLQDDPNVHGLKVCRACRDDYDPYRMPARAPDRIPPPFVRPDVSVSDGLTTPPWEQTPPAIPPWTDEETY